MKIIFLVVQQDGWIFNFFGMTLEAVKKNHRSSIQVFECKIKYGKWNQIFKWGTLGGEKYILAIS